MVEPVFDALIIGGGPAGSAAARLLATWGHSVLLLTKTVKATRSLGESLPPSCQKLFDLLGITAAVNQSGFLASTGNTVWWGEQRMRTARFAEGTSGWQVERRDFDTLLLQLAARAGARLQTDALVRRVELAPTETAPGQAGVTAHFLTQAGPQSIRGRFVLDCSGRTGVIARFGFRQPEGGRTTLALTTVWKQPDGWRLEDETHTLVESYGDGWAWSVPVTRTERYVTLMVDPQATQLTRGHALTSCYDAELAKTSAFRPLLEGATRTATPWGCDASLYKAHTYGTPGVLLVGDAASFIDPLSSYGVKKALASAWLAAVVAHTSLTDASLAGAALDLFNEREREMHDVLTQQSAQFFAHAAQRHLHPFWTGRAVPGGPLDTPDTVTVPDIDRLRQDPAVLAAFDTLRKSRELRLRRSPHLRIDSYPAISARRIVMEDRLSVANWPSSQRGVRFLRDVDLIRLTELAPEHRQVPDLFDTYNRLCPPVGLPDFLGALSVLLAKGVLENLTVQQPALRRIEKKETPG